MGGDTLARLYGRCRDRQHSGDGLGAPEAELQDSPLDDPGNREPLETFRQSFRIP